MVVNPSSQTAFVTGGTGKIGRHLVHRLHKDGFRVKVLSRNDTGLFAGLPGVSTVIGDITDKATLSTALESCEYVFHLAVYQQISNSSPDQFESVNIKGIRTLLSAAKESCAARKIVNVSSIVVFDDTGHDGRNESWPMTQGGNEQHYARTKREALMIARQYHGILPVVTVFPTAVLDPDDFNASTPAGMSTIERFLWKHIGGGIPGGLMNSIGPKDRILNCVMMENVVDGIVRAATHGESGQEYILGGENMSAVEFLRRCSHKLDRQSPTSRIPIFPFKLLTLFKRIIPLPAAALLIGSGGLKEMAFSSEKAIKTLGYSPGKCL